MVAHSLVRFKFAIAAGYQRLAFTFVLPFALFSLSSGFPVVSNLFPSIHTVCVRFILWSSYYGPHRARSAVVDHRLEPDALRSLAASAGKGSRVCALLLSLSEPHSRRAYLPAEVARFWRLCRATFDYGMCLCVWIWTLQNRIPLPPSSFVLQFDSFLFHSLRLHSPSVCLSPLQRFENSKLFLCAVHLLSLRHSSVHCSSTRF